MKAGFHTADITPAIGMEQPGGYGKAYVGSIHDPVKVRAAVLEHEGEAIALVGIDSTAASPTVTRRVRAEVEQRCGIPGDRVLLAASHTHSGGPLMGLVPEEYADADSLVQMLISDYSTIPDPLYADWVAAQTITAICEAWRKREPATVSVGRGHEDQVAFNRRFRMWNGRAYTHPGKGNPNIVEPAGPIDPEVGVVGAWNGRGELLGCVVNYACHGTTFGGGASADWIGPMEHTIQGVFGRDAGVVFLNGAAGDVTQVDNQSPREPEFGERWSRFVGIRVGAEAVKVLVTADPGEVTPIGGLSTMLSLERRAPAAQRVEAARRLVEEGLRTGSGPAETDWTFAKDLLIADYLIRKSPQRGVELQALQLGPAVYVANPAELFCALGLEIKRASPFPFTWVVELANDRVGYVPTADAFEPTGGGYETVLTSYSNLAVGAGARIVETSVKLAGSLKPGEVPRGALASESSHGWAGPQPWSYGVLGPDLE